MSDTPSTHNSSLAKRKLDDAISALDDAVLPRPERPPPQRRQYVSIYATLAKYGIPTSKASSQSSSILNRYRSRTKAKPRSYNEPSITTKELTPASQYHPSSLESLLWRLETFKLATYSTKPPAIDTLSVALYGWMNEGKDRIVCGICAASWVVAGTAGMKKDAAATLVERQRLALVENHKDGCPWGTRQCDASLYQLPLSSPSLLVRDLVERSIELDSLLQDVEIKHPIAQEQIDAFSKIVSKYASKHWPGKGEGDEQTMQVDGTSECTQLPSSQKSLLAALFGWHPAPAIASTARSSSTTSLPTTAASSRAATPSLISPHTHVNGTNTSFESSSILNLKTAVLQCKMCHRRVGLWAFVPSSPPTPSSAPSPQQPRGRKVLDLAREHRAFCAYITPSSSLPSISQALSGRDITDSNEGQKIEGYKAQLETILRYDIGENARRRALRLPSDINTEHEEWTAAEDVESLVRTGGQEVLKYVRRLLG